MEKQKTIVPIAVLGYCDESEENISAMLLNKHQDVGFTAESLAGGFVSLYESFIEHVPDGRQIEFEARFKEVFMTLFDNRAELISTIENVKQPDNQ